MSSAADSEQPSRSHAGGWALLLLIAALAVGYWLTLPPARPALDEACDPEDVAAGLSSWIYGTAFWQKQQDALAGEVETLQDLRNRAKESFGQPIDMTPIEMRMRRLSNKQMQALAAGDEEVWRTEIIFAGHCEDEVKKRLAR